jgi:hypothetical protein
MVQLQLVQHSATEAKVASGDHESLHVTFRFQPANEVKGYHHRPSPSNGP